MSNSLLHSIDELHFGSYDPGDLDAALDVTEQQAQKRLKAVLETPHSERTYENTVLGITRAARELEAVVGLVVHLQSVLGGPWNEASDRASERFAQYENYVNFHRGLYDALVAYQERKDTQLSAPRQKLLGELIRYYERGGIALPEEEQEQLKSVRSRLVAATTTFGQIVVEVDDQAGILVSTKEELDGLPKHVIEESLKAAQEQGKEGFWVAYNPTAYIQVMSECRVRATRQAMYHMYITRGDQRHADLITTILLLRRQEALVLGYKDYADLMLEDRMARTGAIAQAFVNELKQDYAAKNKSDFEELQEFARKQEDDPKLELDASELDTALDFYYAAQLREQKYGVHEQKLKDYFQLDHALEVMFATFTSLYGLTFTKAGLATWHEDVEVYEIRDEGKQLRAIVWCDWFHRKGKQSGAWMNAHYIADRAEGVVDKPHLGYVCANLERPVAGRPSRLSLNDMETIWHEFGHFIHQTLSAPELIEHSAMATRWDFVEAPSQIMENWVWQPSIMQQMSRHHETGEKLNEETIEKLLGGRAYQAARRVNRQLNYAATDLALHIDYDPETEQDPAEYSRRIKAGFMPIPPLPDDAWIYSYTHVFSGGYAAAYYSYHWAEAIEMDLFSRFAEEGITNPKVGRAYRDEILAPGAEREPRELIRAFLSRDTTVDAMLARDGITRS